MKKKIYLAPMDDITDRAFRQLCKENGADFTYTEFVSIESLIRNIDKSFNKISFSEIERPIGIQIFGNNINSFLESIKIIEKYNPDEININCGCPVKKIINKGCGSALLKNINSLITTLKELIKISKIPITIKTRLGWDENSIIIEDFVLNLQEIGIKKVIIHARTRSQMYSGILKLEYLKNLKNNKNINIEIIGNGDVTDIESYNRMLETGVDGVMIGRGAIGNPWIFNDLKNNKIKSRNISEIVNTIKRHIELLLQFKDEKQSIISLRKHFSKYFKNIKNFKEYKIKLITENKIDNIINILNKINNEYS